MLKRWQVLPNTSTLKQYENVLFSHEKKQVCLFSLGRKNQKIFSFLIIIMSSPETTHCPFKFVLVKNKPMYILISLHPSQHSRRLPSCWRCPLRRWPMRSPKRAARAAWRGARATTPPASSIGKPGSGGSAATTWNTAPSFSRSSWARRGSARTWGLRSTPTTSTSEFGWVRTNRPKRTCAEVWRWTYKKLPPKPEASQTSPLPELN